MFVLMKVTRSAWILVKAQAELAEELCTDLSQAQQWACGARLGVSVDYTVSNACPTCSNMPCFM